MSLAVSLRHVVLANGGSFNVLHPVTGVLSKLRWRLDSRPEVQWRDCVELAAVHDLDLDHLRTWASNLGVGADVEALLAQVDDVEGGLDAPG